VVHSDPEILDGTPVFVGTRVPVQNLIDCLDAGDSVEDFLRSFPTVDRAQVDRLSRSLLTADRYPPPIPRLPSVYPRSVHLLDPFPSSAR
jgi:hypothetical protein